MQSFTERINWRGLFTILPLPMLALAASYGVYSFNLLFVPWQIALISAAAFELTYVGLAVAEFNEPERQRGRYISFGAVATSIIYNSLAGFIHRQPDLFLSVSPWVDGVLAALHGIPLALTAFFVADLLLHRDRIGAPSMPSAPAQPIYPQPVLVAPSLAEEYQAGLAKQASVLAAIEKQRVNTELPASNSSNTRTCRYCGQSGLAQSDLMAHGRAYKRHGQCPKPEPEIPTV